MRPNGTNDKKKKKRNKSKERERTVMACNLQVDQLCALHWAASSGASPAMLHCFIALLSQT
jgi:hypothetical protein